MKAKYFTVVNNGKLFITAKKNWKSFTKIYSSEILLNKMDEKLIEESVKEN